MALGPKARPPEQRFWAKVDRSGGPNACWPWLASTNPKGYGRINVGGHVELAHRYALSLKLGRPLRPNEMARHVACDNPPCCNPAHLAPGTAAQNSADMVRADRQNRTLSDAEVVLIKAWLYAGYARHAIARAFGISKRTVQFIERGRLYLRLEVPFHESGWRAAA